MEKEQSHTERGQIERTKRLHEHIERLKSGKSEPSESDQDKKSIKEQIAERSQKRRSAKNRRL